MSVRLLRGISFVQSQSGPGEGWSLVSLRTKGAVETRVSEIPTPVGQQHVQRDMGTKGAVEDVVEVPYETWERIRAEASDVFGQVVATTAEIAALQRKLEKKYRSEENRLQEAIVETERTSCAVEGKILQEIEEEEEKCALVQRELEQLKSVAGEEESWRSRVESWMKIKLAKENAILSQLEVEHERCTENLHREGQRKRQADHPDKGEILAKGLQGSALDANNPGETGPAQMRKGREAYLKYREKHGNKENI